MTPLDELMSLNRDIQDILITLNEQIARYVDSDYSPTY